MYAKFTLIKLNTYAKHAKQQVNITLKQRCL